MAEVAESSTSGTAASAAPAASADLEANEEARNAVGGTRTTAKWIASAFAGIPSLAVIGALIRAPGDSGFEDGYLIAGVLLAAVGAVIGIYGFANVLLPASLTDDQVDVDMSRIPESRFTSFGALRHAVEQQRSDLGVKRVQTADATGFSEAAEKEASAAEEALKRLEAMLLSSPTDSDLKDRVLVAREESRQLRTTAGAKGAEAAIQTRDYELGSDELKWLDELRRAAYSLKASDKVRDRFNDALKGGLVAVAFVALGVIFLALAPKDKAEAAKAPEPTLVTLTLSEKGMTSLGCSTKTVQAIRVGGDDKTPTVITLPSSSCKSSKLVEFTTAQPTALGSVTKVEPIKAK
jgi:hypothetical protein